MDLEPRQGHPDHWGPFVTVGTHAALLRWLIWNIGKVLPTNTWPNAAPIYIPFEGPLKGVTTILYRNKAALTDCLGNQRQASAQVSARARSQ